MVNSFDEFVELWTNETLDIKIRKGFEHLLFLVTFPDKEDWNFGVEKQAQTTTLMMSGGPTGASFGHDVQFCYRSQIHEHLLNCKHTHAMIVSIGMVFDMTEHDNGKHITAISDFIDFANSDEFCKSHIIARPNESAFLHYQHMELNVKMWKNLGWPNMSQKWNNYIKSEENFHDDYTPFWIEVEGLPRIINFTNDERRKKSFSYFRDQDNIWKNLKEYTQTELKDDYYFSRYMTRIGESFYITNTEALKEIPMSEFDIIFSPTAGYNAEAYCNKLDFKNKMIFYDYTQDNIDIKRKIVEMNMSMDEIEILNKTTQGNMVDNSINAPAAERIKDMGTFEELRAMQEEMYKKCEIDYWLMDIIEPDYSRLLNVIRRKNIFFDASNIFGYHMSHAYYTLEELVLSYKRLHEILSYAETCWFQGTGPTKQWERKWISSVYE